MARMSLAALLALAACSPVSPRGDVGVAIVGTGFHATDPDRAILAPADAVLRGATTTGLVALDAQGQVEPALAESWITTADGLSTIFRLRHLHWNDGRELTGDDVAASLNRAIAAGSRNRLAPLLTAVDAVVGMTGRVVEIRLKAPRPNLLQLLAQPELGIWRGSGGLGPYRLVERRGATVRLLARPDDDVPTPDADTVVLHSERTARAIARFLSGGVNWVGGGTIADLEIARAAAFRPGQLRFDPVQGLFGLAVTGRNAFLADTQMRGALAMAVDRAALASRFAIPGWTTTEGPLAARLDSAVDPARPSWTNLALVARRAEAERRIAQWRGSGRALPVLRVALPPGPGMHLLFARLTADWRMIGVSATRVDDRSDADLRLIDAVAPNASANWYLTSLSCAAGLVCDQAGDGALRASREAVTLDERATRLAEADADTARRDAFIALGAPIRWSLVDPALTGWHENVFGVHPLAQLRLPSGS